MSEESQEEEVTGVRARLADQLMGVFDGAAATQKAHWELNPDQRPTAGDIDAIISKYAYMNAAIAGGLSLIPGPFGLFAVIPEIVVVIRNQVKMVYDLGVAFGKEEVMTRELLLAITMSAAGTGTIGLMTMHGGKVLVKRSALRVFQRLVALFAGKVTQRLLKSMIAKWVPLLGAMAMAVWTKTSTARVGARAKEILAMDIMLVEGEDRQLEQVYAVNVADERRVQLEKIRALANLTKVDGKVADEERTYLEGILAALEPGDDLEALRAAIDAPSQDKVDFNVFSDEDDVFALMMDLVAMAHRDGEIHPAEVLYIKQIARRLSFPEDDLAVAISV